MRIELDELVTLGRDIAPPFEIALAEGACAIREIHRLLPGKRLSGRGTHRGREIFVKLFFGRGAHRAFSRDKRGAAILGDCGVRSPMLLLETTTARRGGYALLFDYLRNAQPIASNSSGTPQTPEAGGNGDVGRYATLAVEALAQLHERGAVHSDPNLNNFLIADGKLHLVDGAAIRRTGALARETASLKALAAFLVEFPPAADQRVPELLAHYTAARGWPETSGHRTQRQGRRGTGIANNQAVRASGKSALPTERRRGSGIAKNQAVLAAARIDRLRTELIAARRRRVRRYLAKTERNCTEFRRERSGRNLILARRNQWNSALARFAQDPQAGLGDAEVIKNGRSATVFRLVLGDTKVVVKRYNVKSTPHRIRRWFKHRARIAWRNGHRLALLGIPCAQPIALIERRLGPLRAESWLVMPDCGPRDLGTEVAEGGWSEPVLNSVVRLFQHLQTAGLQHRDTKASNFLVHDGEVHLIDLDGLREHPDSASDLARFLENFAGEAQLRAAQRFAAAGLSPR